MPIDINGITNAWADTERRRLGMPSRDEQMQIEARKALGLVEIQRSRRQEDLDAEMAPLERQARLEKTAAETLELKDRGERAREAMQARAEMAEAERDLKREVAQMKIDAAGKTGGNAEALNQAKARYYAAMAKWKEMQNVNPYLGKFRPKPLVVASPTGEYNLLYDTVTGEPYIPGQMPELGAAGGGGGGSAAAATPPAPPPSTQQSPGSSVTHTNTPPPPTPPSGASHTTPPAASRGSAGAPQNSTVTGTGTPPPTTGGRIPGAGLPTNAPPNAVAVIAGQQQRGMAQARAAALNAFDGIFRSLVSTNADNPDPDEGDQDITEQLWNAKGRELWEKAKGKTGVDTNLRMLGESVRGFVPMLARAVGHVGVLTEMDVQRTEALFPPPGTGRRYTKEKLRYLHDILSGRKTLPWQLGSDRSPVVMTIGPSGGQ